MKTTVRDVIRDDILSAESRNVTADGGRRVVLPKGVASKGVTYRVWVNTSGQIVLDPQVTIPASEVWLFKNKAALATVDKGMAESAGGQTIDRGSFAPYVEDAP